MLRGALPENSLVEIDHKEGEEALSFEAIPAPVPPSPEPAASGNGNGEETPPEGEAS